MKNQDIRLYAFERNIKLWQIAEGLHLQDSNFSRMLRRELPDKKKEEIRAIIDQIATEAKNV